MIRIFLKFMVIGLLVYLICPNNLYVSPLNPQSGKNTSSSISWNSINNHDSFKDRYKYLSIEYQRLFNFILQLSDKSRNTDRIRIFESILSPVERKLYQYPFQLWAAKEHSPSLAEIVGKEQTNNLVEIIENQIKTTGQDDNEMDRGDIENAAAVWLSSCAYKNLLEAISAVDEIFREDFESSNLDKWNFQKNIEFFHIDRTKKASGQSSLCLQMPKPNESCYLKTTVPLDRTQVQYEWHIFLRKDQHRSNLALRFDMVRLSFTMDENKSKFSTGTPAGFMTSNISPEKWHHLVLTVDYQNYTFDLTMDNQLLWSSLPLPRDFESFEQKYNIEITGNSLVQGVWIDGILLKYI